MWLTNDFPSLVKNLSAEAQQLALDRANVLVAGGAPRWCAASLGVTLARESQGEFGLDDNDSPGPSWHVMYMPIERTWLVCSETGEQPTYTFDELSDAESRARELAKEARSAVYVYNSEGGLIRRQEGFGNPIPPDAAFHVFAFEDDWAVKRQAHDGVFERFATKREAISAGRHRARDEQSALVIHYENGDLQDIHVYG